MKKKKVSLYLLIALCVFIYINLSKNDSSSSTENTSTDITGEISSIELPKINEGEVILKYSGMTIKYDTIHLIPAWVAYQLTSQELEGMVERSSSFSMDLNYKGHQAMREDYSNSGWDKGHMAPAADMKWSEKAMRESFYLTNVCPQNHELNTQSWLKLEKWCRTLAKKYSSIYIVTGSMVTTNRFGTIGKNKVTIPDRFFKTILFQIDGKYHSIAFVMNNVSTKQSLKSSSMSVNDLEELSAVDFFPDLDDSIEENVESENLFDVYNKSVLDYTD